MYQLYIANKNYSSWSLRPWVLMSELKIEFMENMLPFGQESSWDSYRKICASGKVPCLIDENLMAWDSLSIVEYLAERHTGVWPADSTARTWARSAAAEMHSGFSELRSRCAMSCGIRIRLHDFPTPLKRDISRISELWNEGLHRFGGPFLAGNSFTAVDAFFAPVAFRIQTYEISLDAIATKYVARILNIQSMRRWYAEALKEASRDGSHDKEILKMGTVVQDFRAT